MEGAQPQVDTDGLGVIPTRMRWQGAPAISCFSLTKGHIQRKQGLVELLCLPQRGDDQSDMSECTVGHVSCSFLSPRVYVHNTYLGGPLCFLQQAHRITPPSICITQHKAS